MRNLGDGSTATGTTPLLKGDNDQIGVYRNIQKGDKDQRRVSRGKKHPVCKWKKREKWNAIATLASVKKSCYLQPLDGDSIGPLTLEYSTV
jgi:hypothetical protein